MDGDGLGPVLLHTQPLLLPTKVHIKTTLSSSDSTFKMNWPLELKVGNKASF